jgi:hypothetical protein
MVALDLATQLPLDVFVEVHAEGFSAQRHEYGTGAEVYCSEH